MNVVNISQIGSGRKKQNGQCTRGPRLLNILCESRASRTICRVQTPAQSASTRRAQIGRLWRTEIGFIGEWVLIRVPYNGRPGWTGSYVHFARFSSRMGVSNFFPKFLGYATRTPVDAMIVLIEGGARNCSPPRELF